MYRMLNMFAFVACITWIYVAPSIEPVAVLLMTLAGFFRDATHGIIGKNIFGIASRTKLIRDLNTSKYSFIGPTWINPRILEDLEGWLSDTGDQIVSININESNRSNRYFGEISNQKIDSGYPFVSATFDECRYSYQYIGRSFSGMHLVRTWSSGGGSGVFESILLVMLNTDSAIEYCGNGKTKKVKRFVIKLIGSIHLGDRYDGDISYKFGFLTIPACNRIKRLKKQNPSSDYGPNPRKLRILVL